MKRERFVYDEQREIYVLVFVEMINVTPGKMQGFLFSYMIQKEYAAGARVCVCCACERQNERREKKDRKRPKGRRVFLIGRKGRRKALFPWLSPLRAVEIQGLEVQTIDRFINTGDLLCQFLRITHQAFRLVKLFLSICVGYHVRHKHPLLL